VNGSEIGTGNSSEELKIIENLEFEHRAEIQGNVEKAIVF
jgi:hypothetical protein